MKVKTKYDPSYLPIDNTSTQPKRNWDREELIARLTSEGYKLIPDDGVIRRYDIRYRKDHDLAILVPNPDGTYHIEWGH